MTKNQKNKVSIIIRTKNEARWIGPCLREVYEQDYDNFEIIIVDNESTDGTLDIIKQFDVKIISIENYLPGYALNEGIRASNGKFIVMISGHCIPATSSWLSKLISNFEDNNVAGVYGRQLPMSFSSPQTKRDLLITFGLDRRIHKKDSFFHNANSVIRRSIWDEIPYDENVTNIEDRIWAAKVLELGYINIYDPQASVFHHHGIHHDNENDRMLKTANIIEGINEENINYGKLNSRNLKIISLIPHKGELLDYNEIPLIKKTIDYSLNSDFIDETIVLTDNYEVGEYSKKFGAKVPFIREKEHSEDFVDLSMVYSFYINSLIDKGIIADLIISLEPSFIWRPPKLIENLVNLLLSGGYDTVVPVVKNYGTAWVEKDGSIIRTDAGNIPQTIKQPLLLGAKGLGFVTHTEYIRNGDLTGNNCGMFPVDAKYLSIDIKSKEDIKTWKFFLDSKVG